MSSILTVVGRYDYKSRPPQSHSLTTTCGFVTDKQMEVQKS